MRKDVKEKWVAALRSDKYKQGKGFLKNNDNFCCLGVLCDVHRKTTKKKGNNWKGDEYLSKNRVLPDEVIKWAGLKHYESNPFVKVSGADYSLAYLNDSYGFNFHRIADVIENSL